LTQQIKNKEYSSALIMKERIEGIKRDKEEKLEHISKLRDERSEYEDKKHDLMSERSKLMFE